MTAEGNPSGDGERPFRTMRIHFSEITVVSCDDGVNLYGPEGGQFEQAAITVSWDTLDPLIAAFHALKQARPKSEAGAPRLSP